MGNVKKFTLRFDMDHPAELQAFRFLKEESERRRVSQNAFLIETIINAMQDPDGADGKTKQLNPDGFVEKIVCGVMQGIREQKMFMQISEESLGLNMSNQSAEEGFLSDDSMEFLDSFEDDGM